MNFKEEQVLQQMLLAVAYIAEPEPDLSLDEIRKLAWQTIADAVETFGFLVLRREDGHLGIMKKPTGN